MLNYVAPVHNNHQVMDQKYLSTEEIVSNGDEAVNTIGLDS